MENRIDDIFNRSYLEIIDRDDELGEFSIKFEGIDTAISISLGRLRNSNKTKFTVSHAVNTPCQATPYRTSMLYGEDWEDALNLAVRSITLEYEVAIRNGFKPDDSWLVPF